MAKEVKETKQEGLDLKGNVVASKDSTPIHVPEMAINSCNCACEAQSNWQIVDDKATEVRLMVLAKLKEGIEGRANMEYLLNMATVYNNIR